MFSSFSSYLPRLSSFARGSSSLETDRLITVPPVKVHDVDNSTERAAKTLKNLIKANHANHAVIYNELRFHNHLPHVLGSAYILGATSEQLSKIYDAEDEVLEPWQDSPSEISREDWRNYLGKPEYQRAFLDFFEDQLVAFGYDWKALIEHYLYEGEEPLINAMACGLGHPLIHLGYGHEFSSGNIAIEALVLTACFYSDLHKYLDEASYTKPASYKSTSVFEILKKVQEDKRFDNLFAGPGSENVAKLLEKQEDAVLDHWNAWDTIDPMEQFEESQKAAAAIAIATHKKGEKFDFFLVHILTSSHATRVMLPLVPPKFQISLVRQWWLFTLLVFIAQLRPDIDLGTIEQYPLGTTDWRGPTHEALTSEYAQDAHYVKAVRSLKNASETWDDSSKYYLKAASYFAESFNGWGGGGY